MGTGKRIRADLVNYARSYSRSRVGLFFGLAFPVILILLFGAIFSGGGSSSTVYVQNLDNGPVGAQFVQALNGTGVLHIDTVASSQNFSQYLLSNSASDGLVIPSNFSASYQANDHVNVTEYWNPSSSTSEGIYIVTTGVLNAFNLQRANGTNVLGVHVQSIKSSSYTYIDYLIPGMIGFAILISPMFALDQH